MRRSVFSIGLMALMLLAAPGGRGRAAAETGPAAAAVTIDNFSFTPQVITVKAGTTVTWTNRDDIPHTVVSTDQVFKSKALDTDQAFSFTLDKPGTYQYFCSIHPHMTAKVVVE